MKMHGIFLFLLHPFVQTEIQITCQISSFSFSFFSPTSLPTICPFALGSLRDQRDALCSKTAFMFCLTWEQIVSRLQWQFIREVSINVQWWFIYWPIWNVFKCLKAAAHVPLFASKSKFGSKVCVNSTRIIHAHSFRTLVHGWGRDFKHALLPYDWLL